MSDPLRLRDLFSILLYLVKIGHEEATNYRENSPSIKETLIIILIVFPTQVVQLVTSGLLLVKL